MWQRIVAPGTMAGWNFEVVPQLQVLHEQKRDVDRFYRVGFEHLECCQSLLQYRGEETRATFPRGFPGSIAPGIM